MTGPSATIVPAISSASPAAAVRWTSTTTTIIDGNRRRTVLRHGEDVDSLALRQLHEEPGTVWALDLMKEERSVVRLTSQAWDFDREHGPPQAAATSGLVLQSRPSTASEPPSPVDPRYRDPWGPSLLGLVAAAALAVIVLLLIPSARDVSWVAAAAAAAGLPYLIRRRWPRAARGTDVFRPRSSVSVPRGFARHARVVHDAGLFIVRTPGRSFSVAGPDDACGAVELRRASTHSGNNANTDAVVLLSASGRPLMWFVRDQWCAAQSDEELASNLGVAWSTSPVRLDLTGRVAVATGSESRDNRIASAAAAVVLVAGVLGADTGGASGTAAVLLGVVGGLIGLAFEIGAVIRDLRNSQMITPSRRDIHA